MIVDLCLTIISIIQTIFYNPVNYAQYVQPDSDLLWAIVDQSLANAPIQQLKMELTWDNRAQFRKPNTPGQDTELHARFKGGSKVMAAIISGLPLILGFALFFEIWRKYKRHPDDVGRRARSNVQGAVKKVNTALRFIKLAKQRELREIDFDPSETQIPLASDIDERRSEPRLEFNEKNETHELRSKSEDCIQTNFFLA